MASNLGVPGFRRCALLQVHALQYRVLAVLLFDCQQRFLHLPFLRQGCFLPGLPGFQGGIIREQIQLLPLLYRNVSLLQDIGCCQIEAADQQVPVNNAVEQLQRRRDDALCGGCAVLQIDGAVGVLGDGPAIAVFGHLALVCAAFQVLDIIAYLQDFEERPAWEVEVTIER